MKSAKIKPVRIEKIKLFTISLGIVRISKTGELIHLSDRMDPNATRPIFATQVLYRCTCGADLQLDPDIGGRCPQCQKAVSAKVLQHELAKTMTILDGSFEVVPSADRNAVPNTSSPDHPTKKRLPLDSSRTVADQTEVNPGLDDPEILIGEKFGHFEIISPLGRGGMGQVYRALDTSLQRYVAVKLLRSGIGSTHRVAKSTEHEVDKLMQEAVSQARVAHPNIVTIYYVGKQNGDPFLAMELVNGKPLSGRIADGNIPFSEITSVAIQICEALKFSYELDVIHGDIKPSNMLLQHNGVAKLSDFGMARRVSRDADNAIGGTPNYIAPELLNGDKPSLQSDIYALGVTLYEMSFGKLPVDLTGHSIADWVSVHEASQLSFPHPWPDRFPESWKKLIEKMLAKAPADRFGDYTTLIDELKRATPHSQVVARPFPRIVAAGFDWIFVLLLAVLMPWAMSLMSENLLISNLLRFGHFLPILIFTTTVYFWRQSLGRSLMHIRVVNRFGLRPKRHTMLARSLVRMQFPWFVILLLLFQDFTASWLGITVGVLVVLSGIFLLVDVAFMAIYDKRRSLHDLMFGTQVVIDMDTSS